MADFVNSTMDIFMKNEFGLVFLCLSFGALASSKEDVVERHIHYVEKQYNAESICYTPIRTFHNTDIHEMFVHTDIVRKLTIFSITGTDGVVQIHESTVPPPKILGPSVKCQYLLK